MMDRQVLSEDVHRGSVGGRKVRHVVLFWLIITYDPQRQWAGSLFYKLVGAMKALLVIDKCNVRSLTEDQLCNNFV